MHEFAIAESLVRSVVEEAGRPGSGIRKVRRVRVAVGRLLALAPESLGQAYGALAEGTAAEGSRLELRSVPVVVRCRGCGWEGEVEPPFFVCGSCGSGGLDVRSGRELYLEEMEVEDHDDENGARVPGSEG